MEYLEGPDQLIPADNLTTCDANGYVKLRSTDDEFDKNQKPQSIPGVLHKIASEHPNEIALITTKGRGGAFKTYTYEDYEMNVRFCAKGFLKLGLKRHQTVCILGFNSPEWFFAELGAIYAGGIATGIYTTNSPESCFHVAYTSKANIIVVEDDIQLQKILQIRNKLPELKAIIQYSGEPTHPDVLSWNDFIELGTEQSDDELEKVMKTIAINECCVLVFTSGTVGNPKGVMLSHDNLIFSAHAVAKQLGCKDSETIVSYLPLSHIAAQIVDIFLAMVTASTIFFADKNALKGSLVQTLQIARPTRFLGVPRVWEKIYENMQQIGAQSGYLKKQLAAWAKFKGLEHNMNKINGSSEPATWGYFFAKKLVFGKIKATLGLDRCLSFCSAAAPLSTDVKKYFLSLDMPIIEAFGMSECICQTLSTPETIDLNSVGINISGVKTKITHIEGEEHGEICMFGRHVCMGYLNEPEKTKESIDDEGWLHSGDFGTMDDKGKVYITGRLKELLITAGGENIAPVPIEHKVKEEMHFVSNAVVIGDKRKFLSLLITLKTEIDEATQVPQDILTKDVQKWLKDLGSEATTVTEFLEEGPHPKVKAAIQKALDKVNAQAISNAQKIQKYAVLPKDFSVADEDFGPTMKLKRHVVVKKYSTIIEELYS